LPSEKINHQLIGDAGLKLFCSLDEGSGRDERESSLVSLNLTVNYYGREKSLAEFGVRERLFGVTESLGERLPGLKRLLKGAALFKERFVGRSQLVQSLRVGYV
jgi:hypothetical protein